MHDQPLASIVIPCFNEAAFVAEAIESALVQAYSPFEVVVIDDGSTDGSSDLVRRFESVRLFRQRNAGLAFARNAGLREARGEYLLFLDADDKLFADALAIGVRALERAPGSGLAYGHVRLIDESGCPMPTPVQPDVRKDHYLELLRRNYIWTTGCIVYRRSTLQHAGGFNRRVSGSADFELNARIAREFPIVCHGKTVLDYRIHDHSMSRDEARMLRSSVTARRLHRRYVRRNPDHRKALESGIRRVQRDYGERLSKRARASIQAGEWRQALRGALTLGMYYPKGLAKVLFNRLEPSSL